MYSHYWNIKTHLKGMTVLQGAVRVKPRAKYHLRNDMRSGKKAINITRNQKNRKNE